MPVDVSAEVADPRRDRVGWFQWWPSARLLRAIRSYQRWRPRGWWAWPLRKQALLRVRLWNIVCACDIPVDAQFGRGLMLRHPTGIVIHPQARIGVNCMIFQGATLGAGPRPGAPTLGGHVDVGAGAKILGGVVIGDHAKIGANAVVLCDVPAHATAVGIPARIILPDPPAPPSLSTSQPSPK
ncbi:MAG TPA: serine acetyltransferase [Phycisphaerae bacterium]|nr:serine acetyltransferase [Phycisphaerae bacterium]